MNILLDTHTFIWFIEGSSELSIAAKKKIEDIKTRNYYRTALSYAYIKNKQYKEAVAHLKAEINSQPFFEVLVTHAYAGEGNIIESKKHFEPIFQSEIKKINEASKRLSVYFWQHEKISNCL